MNDYIRLGSAAFSPLVSGGLWWPDEKTLLVADLHLEKASYFASQGQVLPPYDSHDTLDKLAHDMTIYQPRRVICLGDSFHDQYAFARLHPDIRLMLQHLTHTTEWLWITGNHDPVVDADLGGYRKSEVRLRGVVLRHQAVKDEPCVELSGHYHPKVRVKVRGRTIFRKCFACTTKKIILPSYGSFTGGLDIRHPALLAVLGSNATAVVATENAFLKF